VTIAEGNAVRPQRQPIFNVPVVLVALLGLMIGIHLLRQFLPVDSDIWTLINFGFVPGRLTYRFDPVRIVQAIAAAQAADPTQADIDRAFLNNGGPLWWTPLTYAFLHANWAHVGFNALWLVAFGAPVARRFGAQRFIVFCIGGAVAGALAHYVTHINDLQPVIGASAIDSATMAAAVRFIFQPGASLGESLRWDDPRRETPAHAQPALTLGGVFTDSRAMTFLIFWFVTNYIFAMVSGPGNLGGGGTIAWQAHIGGFLFGLIAFRWFDPVYHAPHNDDAAQAKG
jgi:membrane associated rhomboid family serine protease